MSERFITEAIKEDCLTMDCGKDAVLMKKEVIVVMPADMIVGVDSKGAWCHGSNTVALED